MWLLFTLFYFMIFILYLFELSLLSSYVLCKSSRFFAFFRLWMISPSFLFFLLKLFILYLNNWIVDLPNYCIFWRLPLIESHICLFFIYIIIMLWFLDWLNSFGLVYHLVLSFSFTFNSTHIKISSSFPSYLTSYIQTIVNFLLLW